VKGSITQRWRCDRGHMIDAGKKPPRCTYGGKTAPCGARLTLCSDGIFYIRVELDRSASSERRRRRETIRGTKTEAERRLREILREAETGGFAEGSRITMREVAERWLKSTEHRVGAKSYQRYESMVRLHIIPTIGSLRAENMRPAHVEAALASWTTGKRKDKKKKATLSQRSIAYLLSTLKTICRWAVRMGVFTRNPVDAIDPPRVDRKEMQALDTAGVAALLDAAAGTDLQTPIAVAIGTGLRRGELLALRWGDIDLKAAKLAVRRSLETVDGITRTKPADRPAPCLWRRSSSMCSPERRRRSLSGASSLAPAGMKTAGSSPAAVPRRGSRARSRCTSRASLSEPSSHTFGSTICATHLARWRSRAAWIWKPSRAPWGTSPRPSRAESTSTPWSHFRKTPRPASTAFLVAPWATRWTAPPRSFQAVSRMARAHNGPT
jgi:integrase